MPCIDIVLRVAGVSRSHWICELYRSAPWYNSNRCDRRNNQHLHLPHNVHPRPNTQNVTPLSPHNIPSCNFRRLHPRNRRFITPYPPLHFPTPLNKLHLRRNPKRPRRLDPRANLLHIKHRYHLSKRKSRPLRPSLAPHKVQPQHHKIRYRCPSHSKH